MNDNSDKKGPSPLVRCEPVSNNEKRKSEFFVRIENGERMKKAFVEFEKLFGELRNGGALSIKFVAPPKRKFLQADAKFNDKRKAWIELFVQELLMNHNKNDTIQKFLMQQNVENNNEICLGATEVKSAKPSDFDFLKTVGKGSFGKVYLVRHRLTHKIYAVKVMNKENIKKRNEVTHVMAERNVLISNVNHPFLVALHYSFQTNDKLYFVLDYLNGGELFFHLQKEKRFSEARSRFYAAEIASALGHLHNNNIIYRDLKPENLLLDKNGHVVLTDFGLCKENIKPSDTTETFCGTPEYLAPEIVLKQPYDKTVDWWCLGSVLYEMLIGLPPFYSKDRNEMYNKILNQKLRISPSLSTSCRDLLASLLNKECAKRLGAVNDFEDVKEHAFFAPINFEKLHRKEIKAPYVPNIRGELDISHIDREFTSQQPNPESLIPSKTYGTQRDIDFQGFSFASKDISLD